MIDLSEENEKNENKKDTANNVNNNTSHSKDNIEEKDINLIGNSDEMNKDIVNFNNDSYYNNIIEKEKQAEILNKKLSELHSYQYIINKKDNLINTKFNNYLYTQSNKNSHNKDNNGNIRKNTNKSYYSNTNYNTKKEKGNMFFLNYENFKKAKKINNLKNGYSNYHNPNKEKKFLIFDRLSQAVNKKTKGRQNNKLNKDFISVEKINKRYNNSEWNEIYNKRFKSYKDNIDKRREENRKFYEDEKKRKEDEIIKLYQSKKASNNHIMEASQRMYDEAKKRKIKIEEKKLNNINDTEESIYKYVKKIKSEPYIFNEDDDEDNIFYYKNNSYNKLLFNNYNEYNINNKKKNRSIKKNFDLRKNKRMATSEFNNKRFDKKYRNNKYNNYFKNFRDEKHNSNIIYVDGNRYNLDEERKLLIEMARQKNLHQSSCNNINLIKDNSCYCLKDNKNKQYNSTRNKSSISESDKLIYQFFMRQLEE